MERYNPYELRKFAAPELLFGSGAIEAVDRYINNLKVKKVMVVTDPGVINAGWAEVVERFIRNAGAQFILFSNVSSNPKDTEVMDGSVIYRDEGCDMIVAVGGGSPIDCARGIGLAAANNRNILEFEGADQALPPGPPLICVPTTAGTSAGISQSAMIQDSHKKRKICIENKILIPYVALIDPITTTTMSPELTAGTGMDALVNAFEAYVSNSNSPLTDMNALKAVKLISHNLVPACEHHYDLRYRDRMMFASLLAGIAISNTGPGIIHAMTHALEGLLDLRHSDCTALLLDNAVKFNFYSAADRYCDLALAMGVDIEGMGPDRVKDALVNEIGSLRHRAGIMHTLAFPGVSREIIPRLAEYTINDPFIRRNPRDVSVSDIENIYAKAL